jgi:ParB family transcriptional regulator, chromosome partitioning protein
MAKTAFENRTNAFTFDPEELVLVEDREHPLYDPRIEMPIDEALVRNIMYCGIIQPITIKKEGGLPVVVAGRQRVRAAREANKRLEEMGKVKIRVPAVIAKREVNAGDHLGMAISENELRKDDSPLGKARKCAQYLAMVGGDEDLAAVTFGVTKHCVQQWMKLLDCSTPILKAVECGKIAASAAAKLADLPVEDDGEEGCVTQAEALEAALAESKASGSKVTARAVGKAAGQKSAKMKSRKQILRKLQESGLSAGFKHALNWVLGEENE